MHAQRQHLAVQCRSHKEKRNKSPAGLLLCPKHSEQQQQLKRVQSALPVLVSRQGCSVRIVVHFFFMNDHLFIKHANVDR